MGYAAPQEPTRAGVLPVERITRQAGAALLVAVALVHLVAMASESGGAPYLSVALGVMALASAGLAVAVARGWHPRQALAVGAILSLLALAAYVVSRWIGVPAARGLVGDWGDPTGIASVLFEGLLVALAVAQLPASVTRHAPRPLLRPALSAAGLVVIGAAAILTVSSPAPGGGAGAGVATAQARTSWSTGPAPEAGQPPGHHHLLVPPPTSARQKVVLNRVIGTLRRPGVIMFENTCTRDCMLEGPGLWGRGIPRSAPAFQHLAAQFADPSPVTPAQLRAAERLLAEVRRAARVKFRTLAMARAQGYVRGSAMSYIGKLGGRSPFRHFDKPSLFYDGHTLDPWHPESLVYWMRRHGPPQVVGMMFRASSLKAPPNPLGALLRWHVHAQCQPRSARRSRYAFSPPPDKCGATRTATYGPTTMVHVYLAPRLEAAYADHVPNVAMGIRIRGPRS